MSRHTGQTQLGGSSYMFSPECGRGGSRAHGGLCAHTGVQLALQGTGSHTRQPAAQELAFICIQEQPHGTCRNGASPCCAHQCGAAGTCRTTSRVSLGTCGSRAGVQAACSPTRPQHGRPAASRAASTMYKPAKLDSPLPEALLPACSEPPSSSVPPEGKRAQSLNRLYIGGQHAISWQPRRPLHSPVCPALALVSVSQRLLLWSRPPPLFRPIPRCHSPASTEDKTAPPTIH